MAEGATPQGADLWVILARLGQSCRVELKPLCNPGSTDRWRLTIEPQKPGARTIQVDRPKAIDAVLDGMVLAHMAGLFKDDR